MNDIPWQSPWSLDLLFFLLTGNVCNDQGKGETKINFQYLCCKMMPQEKASNQPESHPLNICPVMQRAERQ
jgi:hypothetical protein